MNYDKIKRTGILFLLGIGAITSLSCNDNDNANYPERVPTRLSVMPLPERVDYKESVVSLPQNVTVSQNIPASTSQLLKSTLEEKLSLSVSDASNRNRIWQKRLTGSPLPKREPAFIIQRKPDFSGESRHWDKRSNKQISSLPEVLNIFRWSI